MPDQDATVPFTWEHVLYRFRDADGVLLYVGITNHIQRRFSQHARKSTWWGEVASCQIEFFPSRAELAAAELKAIEAENPLHNIIRDRVQAPQGKRHRYVDPDENRPATSKLGRRLGMTQDEWNWMHYLGKYAGKTNDGAPPTEGALAWPAVITADTEPPRMPPAPST